MTFSPIWQFDGRSPRTEMNHYIIHRKHRSSEAFFSHATSPREAMRTYAPSVFARADGGGLLVAQIEDGSELTFRHELEAIECCEKAVAIEWSMQRVNDANWDLPYAQSFCGYNPWDIEGYIKLCRRAVGPLTYLPVGTFVWYLKEGVLVTFFRPNDGKPVAPDAIGERFLVPNSEDELVVRWTDDYDDLLGQMTF